jgi:guanylate kinase
MSQSRPQPLLIVLSAPSGGGKTTLVKQMLAARPDMTRVVTCTTRAPRPGEVEGVDYYFLDGAAFERHAQAGDFLEHANVYGNRYGTLKAEVLGKLRQGRDVLLNVDVQGVASICACAADDAEIRRAMFTVFLTPPTLDILEKRLAGRGTDAPEVVARRLAVARAEVAEWRNFEYLLISSSVAEDLRRMQVIIEAEKMRSARSAAPEI